MQHAKTFQLAMGVALGLQIPASAGPETQVAEAASAAYPDWCEWLQNKPGTLFKDKDNPYFQEFQIEGRFQYQAAYLEGNDVNGRHYNESYDEFRRARIGVKAKFLQYFGTKVVLNMVDDQRNASPPADLDWGYSDFDEAFVSFDIGKAMGQGPFEALILNYGRQKFTFGYESHTSSTKLLTLERSAISNKVYGSYRPTGLSVDATKNDWTFGAALYSSTTDGEDNQAFNGWQDSAICYLTAGYKASDQLAFGTDFVWNDADVAAGEDSVMDYAWAASVNAKYDVGPWGVIGDVIYGDNGGSDLGHAKERSGAFWGAVVMPYYWLIENKLQLVGQYQYQGSSESEGSRVNSRYGRANADIGIDVNGGRGDSHHSLYAGLNYYLCGDNAKIQAGVEYQTMDTPKGDFDTLTYVIGFRTFF